MTNSASAPFGDPLAPLDALAWYLDAGVDETIGDHPVDRYELSGPQPQIQALAPSQPHAEHPSAPQAPPTSVENILRDAPAAPALAARSATGPANPSETVRAACTAAAAATTVDELRLAVINFDGCALKKTATSTVFADGNPKAPVMVIGDAPGADEDRQGLPFIGAGGRLLDRMLGAIGLDRTETAYLTNLVFWRPPGNRTPNPTEIATCLPFVERHIELVQPKILIILGGPAAKSLLGQQAGITRLRGTWVSFETPGLSHPIATMPIYHPDYLRTSPAQKRAAWHDLLAVRTKLDTMTKPS